jgi:1-acyl-sn-glycerol-3-phosphate acyltransferase
VANQRDRRIRFLAKAELFKNPVLGALLRAGHQIPVYRGTADSSGALSAAVDALREGECVTVFPEGTISEDFEPMRGKSGTARLAQASGVPIVPIGLWGTHRLLTKGRKPHLQWGIAQVAVVGAPVHIAEDDRPREATLRIMDAITDCVARARAIYPEHPESDDDTWWWRDPETAGAHRRPA